MNPESRVCQNCKQNFTIEPEDFAFYEKISVPPPTWCPECRSQRRLIFRNERSLYKRKCDSCGVDIISIYSSDKPFIVYCGPCWWSDKWDGLQSGVDYDPNRSFFEQFRELQKKVPRLNLNVEHTTTINSEYVNNAGHLKNCYLVFSADTCENVYYAKEIVDLRDSMDCHLMVGSSQLCYEDVNCSSVYKVFFSADCIDCNEVYFSKNLVNCQYCFGCINLRNKNYHFFNAALSKDDYQKRMKDLKLDYFSEVERVKQQVVTFWLKYPNKFFHGHHNVNVSGDYIYDSKNARHAFGAWGLEDSKFCNKVTMSPAKDVYDYFEWGNNAQRVYECITVGENAADIKFSYMSWKIMEVEYSIEVISSSYIFGCVGLKKNKYCILNKQYSESDFRRLRERIVSDMNERPYTDARGRVFRYGDFFPSELSPFAYNEASTMDYFPLSKDESVVRGYRWYDSSPSEYRVTLDSDNIPDSIREVSDSILGEVIRCQQCVKPFKIIRPELELLRNFRFPIPRKCPECRIRNLMGRANPPKLWHRKCHCAGARSENGTYQNTTEHFHKDSHCPNEFETSYALDRPEIVYCEACYLKEVV